MLPLLEEICRTPGVGAVQSMAFNRWQRLLRTEVQPLLVEREQLGVWKAPIDAQAARALPADESSAPVVVKRGPGRPRKVEVSA